MLKYLILTFFKEGFLPLQENKQLCNSVTAEVIPLESPLIQARVPFNLSLNYGVAMEVAI